MENKEQQTETSYIKTKCIKLFSTKVYQDFTEVEDKVNEFCLEIKMLTGKHPKIEFRDSYIAVHYFDAEEIEYDLENPDLTEEEIEQTNNYYNTIK
jgi:hypothetical protein